MYILFTILVLIFISFMWTYLWKPIILKFHVAILTTLLFNAFKYYKMDTNEANEKNFKIVYEMYNRAANAPRDFSFREFKIILNHMIIDKSHTQQIENQIDDYTRKISMYFANSMFSCFLLRSPVFAFPVIFIIVFAFIKASTLDKCSQISEKFLHIIGGKNKPQDFIEQGCVAFCKSARHCT